MTIRAALLFALLPALLLAPGTAGAASAIRASAAPTALPAPATPAPELLSAVTPDVPQSALDAQLDGDVQLLVRVTAGGWVDSVCVASGDARLRESAVAAARWHLYRPQPGAPRWAALTLSVHGAQDVDALVPDPLALAREAEQAADWRGALDAYTGALARLGTHPTIMNEWALREHVMRTAARLTPAPSPGAALMTGNGARTRQERVIARGDHADLVATFDRALRVAPWWGEAYLWRAASEAGCGRTLEATRSLRLYQLSRPDSAGLALSLRALDLLAASDTLTASELIKRQVARPAIPAPR